MRAWIFEATDGRPNDDPVRNLLGSLCSLAMSVHALHRLATRLDKEVSEEVEPSPDTYANIVAMGGLAQAIVTMLGQMDDHIRYARSTDAWSGQLAELGDRFASEYGQIKNARDLGVHLAPYILDHPDARLVGVKDWWHPGPGTRWGEAGLKGIHFFGRDYDLVPVIDAAIALSALNFED
jgi:hypothetical protein